MEVSENSGYPTDANALPRVEDFRWEEVGWKAEDLHVFAGTYLTTGTPIPWDGDLCRPLCPSAHLPDDAPGDRQFPQDLNIEFWVKPDLPVGSGCLSCYIP